MGTCDVGRAGLARRYAEWLRKPLVVHHRRREGVGKVLAEVIRRIHRGGSIGPIVRPALPGPEGEQ